MFGALKTAHGRSFFLERCLFLSLILPSLFLLFFASLFCSFLFFFSVKPIHVWRPQDCARSLILLGKVLLIIYNRVGFTWKIYIYFFFWKVLFWTWRWSWYESAVPCKGVARSMYGESLEERLGKTKLFCLLLRIKMLLMLPSWKSQRITQRRRPTQWCFTTLPPLPGTSCTLSSDFYCRPAPYFTCAFPQ